MLPPSLLYYHIYFIDISLFPPYNIRIRSLHITLSIMSVDLQGVSPKIYWFGLLKSTVSTTSRVFPFFRRYAQWSEWELIKILLNKKGEKINNWLPLHNQSNKKFPTGWEKKEEGWCLRKLFYYITHYYSIEVQSKT